tara:strand:- start:29353 stop:30732 length:1380 start_codon:yes stop_codon:yes gene_type:complete
MKVKYFSHASFQIITKKNTKILTDPWASNPIYGNTLCLFPQLNIKKDEYLDQDYIYISHDHPDHLCLNTMDLFNKKIKIIIRKYKSPFIIKQKLSKLGFKNIIELDDEETFELKEDFNLSLYVDESSTDSLCLIHDKDFCFLDQNDCLLTQQKYKKISKKFKIDLGALFYSGGSMFPGCFDFTTKEKIKITKKRIVDQFEYSIETAKLLNVKNVIPGANDMCFLNKSTMDKFSSALPFEYYNYVKKKKNPINVILMQSGDIYDFRKKFKNNHFVKSKEEWFRKVDAYRNSNAIKILREKIKKFENVERTADINEFERLLKSYMQSKKFLFSESLGYNTFRVFFEINCSKKKECFVIHFSKDENKLIKTTERFSEKKNHMKISINENFLQMCMDGEYTWEDMMNNKFKVIRKLNQYDTNEYNFWIFLSEFTDYLNTVKKQKLSHLRDMIKKFCWDINVTS